MFTSKKIRATFLIGILIPLTVLSASEAQEIHKAGSLPKAKCRIEIDNAHYSTSMLKNLQSKFVKINARSICNVSQRQVTLTVEIYKYGFLGEKFLAKFETNPLDRRSNGLTVRMNSAKIKCQDNKPTLYFGVAYAKAEINGQWQFAGRTRTPKTISLNCGT